MPSHPLALSLLLGATAACSPRAPAPDRFPDRVAAVVDSFRIAHAIPGIAVGVLRPGHPNYARGFGTVRLGSDSAVTPATVFHMASVTKPFVATAVLQLVEQGDVSLDSSITSYVPWFRMKDPRYREITVRQLLTHTAGMPDVTDYRWEHPEYDAGSLERYIRGLADSTLIAAPGKQWAYSNIGFELLAQAIATVSGEEFETYVQRHILTPAGMKHSTLLMTDVDSAHLATGHLMAEDGTVTVSPVYPYNRRHAASSTLHSNLTDMLRWARVNLGHGAADGTRILPATAYGPLWTPVRDLTAELQAAYQRAGLQPPFASYQIGLSWFIIRYRDRVLIEHGGSDRGFRSSLILVPQDSVAIVVLANGDRADVEAISRTILDLLFTDRPKAP